MAAKMLARTASSKLVGVGHKLFTSQARPILGFQRVCCTEDFVSRDLRARAFHTIGALRERPATPQSQPGSKKLLSTQSAHVDPPLLPAVRLLIDTHGLHRELIKPTGPKGRILKGDVLSYLKGSGKVSDATMLAAQDKPFPQPKPTVDKPGATGSGPSFLPVETEIDFQDIPNSGVRKTIASRLTAAKTSIPHAYAGLTCNISKVVDLRRQLKKDGVLLTLNDFVVKAVAMALKNVPDMNSQWTGKAAVAVPNVDVSIAVATDKGLITPIVRDVDQLELTALSKAVQGLAQKAREGKLTPQEYQGGSFTVSNLGMFGLDHFSAIINPPQTCIMAVGGMKLSLSEDGTINSHITVTLSYDGRAHSESVAFNFLQQFKVYLEDPFGYLIS